MAASGATAVEVHLDEVVKNVDVVVIALRQQYANLLKAAKARAVLCLSVCVCVCESYIQCVFVCVVCVCVNRNNWRKRKGGESKRQKTLIYWGWGK